MTRLVGDWISAPGTVAVMAMLQDAGHQAWFVGGCVRDALLGRGISDIDVTTDARPDVVMDLAEAAGLRAIPTGIEHGTITVISDRPFEVTTFRKDVETDGRRAVVAFADSLEEDAQRRDLTINALYADAEGLVCDPVGGLDDLKVPRLRFVGDAAQRIAEDHLRSLRYFRFYAWFGDPEVGPDAEAIAAISANIAGLDTLSGERVGAEVMKLLSAPDPAPGVAAMAATGALAAVLPGATTDALAPLVHLEGDLAPDPIRRLAAICADDQSARLRLSRADGRLARQVAQGARDGQSAGELGYRLGADRGLDAVLVRSALLGVPVGDADRDAVQRGAAATFPVRASDIPLEGPELGRKLKELEARWIAADFGLTKAALLAG